MIKKTIHKIAIRMFKKRGYSAYMAPKVWYALIDDYCKSKDIPFWEKMWAYKRGFFNQSIQKYGGLSEDDCQFYLSDMAYYKLFPINGNFSKWIDDKLTLRHIFSPYADYLPKYYYQLNRGRVLRLLDCPQPAKGYGTIQEVLALADEKKCLAVKLLAGEGGHGFHKLSSENGILSIDGKTVTRGEAEDFLTTLDNYLVTEYIIAHAEIRKIYDVTPNSLRLITIYDPQEGSHITGAYMRFGVKSSGMVDNVRAGGISSFVGLAEGDLFCPKAYSHGRVIDISVHPDTGAPLNGRLPHWDLIKQKILEIGNAYPQLKFLGFDIIITPEGFKIIEINSFPDVPYMQICYPSMKTEIGRRFFTTLLNQKSGVKGVNA